MQGEQLLSHESKLKQMSQELEEHRKNSPSADPKSREWEEFRLKEHYLTYEVRASHPHFKATDGESSAGFSSFKYIIF